MNGMVKVKKGLSFPRRRESIALCSYTVDSRLRGNDTVDVTSNQQRATSNFLKALCVAGSMGLAACSSAPQRVSNPVQVEQAGDVNKSCPVLVREMEGINQAASQREEKTRLNTSNLMSGQTGVGVDVKNFRLTDKSASTKEEIDALYRRYQYLDMIARRKNCYQ